MRRARSRSALGICGWLGDWALWMAVCGWRFMIDAWVGILRTGLMSR